MFAKIIAKLSKKYRVSLVDNDSFSQSRHYVLRPFFIYLFFSIITLMIIAGTASLIVYTPIIREQIPGYTNPELEDQYITQQEKVLELQEKVMQQDSSLASLLMIYGVNRSEQEIADINQFMADVNVSNYDYANDEHSHDHGQENEGGGQPPREGKIRQYQGFKKINGVMNLISPVKGIITNSFNTDEKHYGIDLVANENALIKSVAEGFVVFSEYSNQTGYVIGIAHGNNLISFYKHNSRVYKKVGSYVFSGEAIAVIGNSGENSTGPHLHFELWHQGKPVNPAEYVTLN